MRIPTCRDTTLLLSQKQDRALGFVEHVALYLHLMVCNGCRQFKRQLAFMRSAVQRYLERDDHLPR